MPRVTAAQATAFHPRAQDDPLAATESTLRVAEVITTTEAPPPAVTDAAYEAAASDAILHVFRHLRETDGGLKSSETSITGSSVSFKNDARSIAASFMGSYVASNVGYVGKILW